MWGAAQLPTQRVPTKHSQSQAQGPPQGIQGRNRAGASRPSGALRQD